MLIFIENDIASYGGNYKVTIKKRVIERVFKC